MAGATTGPAAGAGPVVAVGAGAEGAVPVLPVEAGCEEDGLAGLFPAAEDRVAVGPGPLVGEAGPCPDAPSPAIPVVAGAGAPPGKALPVEAGPADEAVPPRVVGLETVVGEVAAREKAVFLPERPIIGYTARATTASARRSTGTAMRRCRERFRWRPGADDASSRSPSSCSRIGAGSKARDAVGRARKPSSSTSVVPSSERLGRFGGLASAPFTLNLSSAEGEASGRALVSERGGPLIVFNSALTSGS